MSVNLKFGKVDIKMVKKITNRLGWKIFSVVLAFFLWLGVVNYEDPIITKPFKDVPVQKLNAFEITSQNKHIEYLEGETVDIVVKGKRSIIEELTENHLKVYADLAKVSITGAVDIEVEADLNVEIVSTKPGDLKIMTEDILTITRNIQYYFIGEADESFIALDPKLSPNRVQITGPESQVLLVSSVIVPIPITGANSDVVIYVTPQLLDNNKNEVMKVTSDIGKVQIQVPIQMTKTIPIIFQPKDSVGEAYRLTEAKWAIENVLVRGYENDLAKVKSITVEDISLADLSENAEFAVELDKYLPEGVKIADQNRIVNLNLTIQPLVEKEITIRTQDIAIKNIPEGLKFAYINDTQEIFVLIRGISADIELIDIETLDPVIRLNGVEEGEQAVQLFFSIPVGVEFVSEDVLIDINMTKEFIPTENQ